MILATDDRLSRREAAELLGVTPWAVGKWTRDGLLGVKLEAHWVGLRAYYTRGALERFQSAVDERRQPIRLPRTREAARAHDDAMERVRKRCAR